MCHSLAWRARLNLYFSIDASQTSGFVRGNIPKHVLIAGLFGDLAERVFHVARGAPAVDVSTCGRTIDAQQSQRTFSQCKIRCHGIHLDTVLEEEIHIIVE